MGHPEYEVTAGSARYKGVDLFELEPEQRSHMGLFLRWAGRLRWGRRAGGAARAGQPAVRCCALAAPPGWAG